MPKSENKKEMYITKASRETEAYNQKKFCSSLRNSGVPRNIIQKVCGEVERDIFPGITTKELSDKTFGYLLKENPNFAARYSLKNAIMELGPSGFAFEQYISKVLKNYGYKTKTNQIIRGKCVSHEVDVIAEKEKEKFFIEAKYHNSRGIKSDVKVAMYTYARILDIRESMGKSSDGWLITNTKFTSNAKKYGKCIGLKMTGWKYPKGESLEKMIEEKELYPITILPSVNQLEKERFIENGIFLARDVLKFQISDFKKMGINYTVGMKIFNEVKHLYGG